MFRTEDIRQIAERGSQIEVVQQQIKNFITGFPFQEITESANNFHGIIKLSEKEVQKYSSVFDDKVSAGLELIKFVPASGAASRMFKSLFSALENLQKGGSVSETLTDPEVSAFFHQLDQFSFFPELQKLASVEYPPVHESQIRNVLELFLFDSGLNYGNLPKGLLKFHQYPDRCRTSFEEHLVEGAHYSKNSEGKVKIHFTVSPEHQELFETHLEKVQDSYEKIFGVNYEIGFSWQKPSTDTIAVGPDNLPFRNNDGSLLFRPAGHGALLENLNDLDADLIFIKNIDNVVHEKLIKPTVDYKKALAGVLLSLQEQLFYYQKMLNDHHHSSLESAFYAEAANFLENVLHISPPQNQYYSEKEELYHYFRQKFNRPIRVCGMVKNQGEPGGGPFFVENRDGSVSLQILESSQINFQDRQQSEIAQKATHFNPVDLVCAVKNYKGEKYNLLKFCDRESGFISIKSKDGKEIKAQELPGLWNGSMSDWNTLFVEVPIETFNPVKTVNDLLRKEHQTN